MTDRVRVAGPADPPPEQPYGIETSSRDPSGNDIRLTAVLESSRDRRR